MIKISIDLGKCFSDIKKTVENKVKITNDIFKEACTELKQNTEERTPEGKPELWKYLPHKDYVSGELKKSWDLQFNGAYSAVLSNDKPYAHRVEFGWSSQAPEGMLRKSIAEFPKIVNELAIKYKF